jgi:hypothetical protein
VALLLRISHFTRQPQPLVTPMEADDATQVVRLR